MFSVGARPLGRRPTGRRSVPRLLAEGLVVCLVGVVNALPLMVSAETAQFSPLDELIQHPGFVGAASCGRCHTDIKTAWQGSHHHGAMLPPTPESVLGNFNNTEVTFGGVRTRFFKRDGDFFIETEGEDGVRGEFPVDYTFGVYPLQQYLLPLDRGRLQAFNIAWDTRPAEAGGQRWFHLYPDPVPVPGERLHWTGADQNWNHMCAECHSTDLIKAYDPERRTYRTSYAEVNVACESCHGPGREHVAWAEAATGTDEGAAVGVTETDGTDTAATGTMDAASVTGSVPAPNKGFRVRFSERHGVAWQTDENGRPKRSEPRRTEAEIDTCARCHSRRGRLTEAVTAGAHPEQSHRLALLAPGLYHVDGQVDDEVYVYGSFLQSRMYAAGVTCGDCHDPHSLSLRAPGDAMCLSCHQGQGLDSAAHHHHPESSDGARCVSCHMPEKTFMGVDRRRDHSFRIPRPDQTLAYGVPNACNSCHEDRDAAWAEAALSSWFGEERLTGYQTFAETFHLSATGHPAAPGALLALAQNPSQPAIARASATADLGNWLNPAILSALQDLRASDQPRVRRAAVFAMAALPPNPPPGLLAETIAPALTDEVRSVRVAAVEALRSRGAEGAQILATPAARRALADYTDTVAIDADRPEGQLALAGDRLADGDVEGAEAAYREALRIEPGYPAAVVNLADLYRGTGRDTIAGQLMAESLAMRSNADIAHAYGLWLIRRRESNEALRYLEQAAAEDPQNPRYGYVLAVAQDAAGQRQVAMQTIEAVLGTHPWHRDSLAAAVLWQQQAGEEPGEYAERLLALQRADRGG